MRNVIIITLLIVSAAFWGCSDNADDVTGGEDDNLTRYIVVPLERPTIQSAVDVANRGDTILVVDGTYTGPGNRDIVFSGKSVVLMSENGAEATIIDLQGSVDVPHLGFDFADVDESSTVIDGFTIRNGYSAQGSGMNFKSAAPTVKNCVFYNNAGTVSGGAIRCKSAAPRFVNCTFVSNSAPTGGTIMLIATSAPVFENCIVTLSTGGEAVTCSDTFSEATFSCSNVFGNEMGDWIGCLAAQAGLDGNMSTDPMFCEPSVGNFTLDQESPCAAANNSCGVLIGALGAGCGGTAASGS